MAIRQSAPQSINGEKRRGLRRDFHMNRLAWIARSAALAALAAVAVVAFPGEVAHTSAATAPAQKLRYTGVNFAGASFGAERVPGKINYDYFYPKPANIDYFANKGMNIIRLSVLWERLQHQAKAKLDEEEMQRIDAAVRHASSKGMKTIIDVHNYAEYFKKLIGTPDVPVGAFADLWRRIAARYKANQDVVFGLMNEPKGLRTETWLEAANAAIQAIRQSGAQNLILVPGNGWSSARDWMGSSYGTSNSKVMLGVADPRNNYLIEVHQYFDRDFTGTHAQCQSADIGVQSLAQFTEWAREHGKRAFLGEFGAGANATCLAALDNVLKYVAANSDVWVGWTFWAAGPWAPDYYTSIEPVDGRDRPQMTVLEKHIAQGQPRRPARR